MFWMLAERVGRIKTNSERGLISLGIFVGRWRKFSDPVGKLGDDFVWSTTSLGVLGGIVLIGTEPFDGCPASPR